MPYKRKPVYKRKPRARRQYRRRRRNTQGYQSGMPKVRTAKLRYSQTISLTSTSGLLDSYVFRANGCNDPNVTGIGSQPMGWDQWGLMYNHYIVKGAKISVQQLAGGTAAVASISGAYIAPETTIAYTDPQLFIQAKKGTWRTQTHQRKPTKFHCKFSTKKFYNIKDIKDNYNRLGSLVTADPQEGAYFQVWFADLTTSTTTQTYQIVIDYIVEFSEPKNQVAS